MLVYVAPILTLIVTVILVADVLVKDEKYSHVIKLVKKTAVVMLGIVFLVMVIGLVIAFVRLNF